MSPEGREGDGADSASLNIAARAIRGSAYTGSAGAITLLLGLTRTVLLVRLLFPSDFGLFAMAVFFNSMANQLRSLGLHSAFLQHREHRDEVTSTYFLIRTGLLVVSVGALVAAAPAIGRFYPAMPMLSTVIVVYAAFNILQGLNAVQESVLTRDLRFRAVARNRIAVSATTTVIAPLLAWLGFGVWSLVSEIAVAEVVRAALLWGPGRPWRPRLAWSPSVARSLLRYGRRMWVSTNLDSLLQRFDDFWIGTTLGDVSLGFYSRAYEFGQYVYRALGNPFSVVLPTFARLQDDRLRLSQFFFRTTGVLVRLVAGIGIPLVLLAPAGVRLILGERWMPMSLSLQLMLVFALVSLVTRIANELCMATGNPQVLVRVRFVQLCFFVPAVMLASSLVGIAGVASVGLATTLLGVVLFLRQLKPVVDFSTRKLFFWPIVGVGLAALSGSFLASHWTESPALALGARVGGALTIYVLLLWIAERRQWIEGYRLVRRLLAFTPAREPRSTRE